jgi:hypothetical protein
LKPVALISPVWSLNSTLNNLPSPFAFLYVLIFDLFITLALMDHLLKREKGILNQILNEQALWLGFYLF